MIVNEYGGSVCFASGDFKEGRFWKKALHFCFLKHIKTKMREGQILKKNE